MERKFRTMLWKTLMVKDFIHWKKGWREEKGRKGWGKLIFSFEHFSSKLPSQVFKLIFPHITSLKRCSPLFTIPLESLCFKPNHLSLLLKALELFLFYFFLVSRCAFEAKTHSLLPPRTGKSKSAEKQIIKIISLASADLSHFPLICLKVRLRSLLIDIRER